MEEWYTLYTKPNSEYQVANGLQEQEIHTYLPELELPRKRPGRKRTPFFPCYLFAKIDLDRVSLSSVQWTPGLRCIVAFDGRPVPLPEEAIDLIRYRLDTAMAIGDSLRTHTYRVGDTVRITSGPLQDLLAVFEGPTAPSERVQVLLTFLGHARRAWVPVTDLEKATAGDEATTFKRPRRTRGRGRRIRNN